MGHRRGWTAPSGRSTPPSIPPPPSARSGVQRRLDGVVHGEDLQQRGDAEDLEQPLGVDDQRQPPAASRTFFRVPTSTPRPVESMNGRLAGRRRGPSGRSRAARQPYRSASADDTSISPSTSTTVREPTSRLVTRTSRTPLSLPADSNRRVGEGHEVAGPHLAESPERGRRTTASTGYPPVTGWSTPNTTGCPSGGTCTAPGTRPSDGSSRPACPAVQRGRPAAAPRPGSSPA